MYKNLVITESEKNRIRRLYGLNKDVLSIVNTNNYLFDFVITESQNFIIYMDNVISKKHGFIGDLWENTWVFNEVIKEGLEKNNALVIENFGDNIDTILNSISWTKEFVSECVLKINSINENINIDEQFFDKLKTAASNIVGDVVSGVKKAGSYVADLGLKLIKGPILGTLRWIRRNAYTSIGMVVDILTAMLPATTGLNKVAWMLIVVLDLYEIVTGDYDPKDEERNSNPYMFLVIDLIAALFSAAFGQTTKAALKGSAKLPSATSKLLSSLLEKLPALKNTLKTFSEWLLKKLPKLHSIIKTVFSGIDRIIVGVENFIKQLLSKRGLAALATGGAIAWFFEPRNLKVGDSGNDILAVNQFLSKDYNLLMPECPINKKIADAISKDGNKFTKNTEQGVKTFEACIMKDPELKGAIKTVDGQITNQELALYCNVEMDDRGVVTKFIPHSTKEMFNKTTASIIGNLTNATKKVLSPIAAK